VSARKRATVGCGHSLHPLLLSPESLTAPQVKVVPDGLVLAESQLAAPSSIRR
jgi:hypothetical protein